MRFFLFLIISLSIVFVSCKKDDDPPLSEEECADVNSAFATQVQPIFAASCALSGCHDQSSAEAGLRFNTHSNIKQAIESNQQQFLASINFDGGASGWMPRSNATQQAQASDKLPGTQIEIIECWITRGMPND